MALTKVPSELIIDPLRHTSFAGWIGAGKVNLGEPGVDLIGFGNLNPQGHLHLGSVNTAGVVDPSALILGTPDAFANIGDHTLQVGSGNAAEPSFASVLGQNNQVLGTAYFGHIVGYNNTMTDASFSTIFGSSNTMSPGGSFNFIMGTANVMAGEFSSIWGPSNINNGQFTHIFGPSNNAQTGAEAFIYGVNHNVHPGASWVGVFGGNHVVGSGGMHFVAGTGHTVGDGAGYATIFGSGNTIQPSGYNFVAGTGNTSGSNGGAFIAGGNGNQVYANNALCGGFQCYIPNGADDSFVFGFQSSVTAPALYSIAVGYGAQVHAAYGVAFGRNTTTAGEGSLSFGYGGGASGQNSACFGFFCAVGGNSSAAWGFECSNNGDNSLVVGVNNVLYGTATSSLIIGQTCQISNAESGFAFGRSASVTGGEGAGALGGYGNSASGQGALALGGNLNLASFDYAIAAGLQSTASWIGSRAWGYKAQATYGGEFVLTDYQTQATASDTSNQFKARFLNGFNFTKGSGTDYVDGVEYRMHQDHVQTTDGATEGVLYSEFVPNNCVVLLEARVTGFRTGGSSGVGAIGDSYVCVVRARFTGIGADVEVPNVTIDYENKDQAWSIAVHKAGSNMVVGVLGAADTNITWHSTTITQRLIIP
jgi:hypothetical protein